MDRQQLKATQDPLRMRCRDDPDTARITPTATGSLGEGILVL
ncbi:MAG: hypothetical protein WCE80_08780 [Acidimicrobiia bacterium]